MLVDGGDSYFYEWLVVIVICIRNVDELNYFMFLRVVIRLVVLYIGYNVLYLVFIMGVLDEL